ncbi:MAG: hypothetical protein KME47_10005 [Nodosilinea sp. WJT8-NPBG4]|jgi:hypothetical protein|nr:hypothetical protein [Nodosilinea sp. WJT8-NPBG4]
MKIKYVKSWHTEERNELLSTYVEGQLQGSYYDGELEQLKSTVEKLKEFNGRLVELLISKGLIDVSELKDLLETYDEIKSITD